MTAPLPKALIFIIGISFLLHIVGLSYVVLKKGEGVLVYGDALGYLSLAEHLRGGLGFVSETPEGLVPQVVRTPGFPLLLTPFVAYESGLIVYLALLTSLAALLLPYFTWWIGQRLFNERTGLVAAGIVAFEPMLTFFSWFPLTEIPFLILFLSSIAVLLKSLERKSFLLFAICSGVLVGYSILIRPSTLLFFVGVYVVLLFANVRDRRKLLTFVCVGVACAVTLAPWYYRTHTITGVWALSSAGWANVYGDYLPSIRALNNNTTWNLERKNIQDNGYKELGLATPQDIYNPSYGQIVRDAALSEIRANIPTVLKLESALLFSFFTNDGWYYSASKVGLIPRLPVHISPTGLFLEKGFGALPQIWGQLAGQFFVPVVGRLVALLLVFLGILGVFRGVYDSRFRVALLCALFVALAAIASTALGFGVEARLRISVMPVLFLLAALGADWLLLLWSRKKTGIRTE